MRSFVYCKTRYEKGCGVSFHKFPSDYSLKLWLKKMKLVNWTPKTSDYLYSKHFTDDCLLKHGSRTALKKCSIPTIFLETDSSLVTAETDSSTYDDPCSRDSPINLPKSNSPVVHMQVQLPTDDSQYSQMNPEEAGQCSRPIGCHQRRLYQKLRHPELREPRRRLTDAEVSALRQRMRAAFATAQAQWAASGLAATARAKTEAEGEGTKHN